MSPSPQPSGATANRHSFTLTQGQVVTPNFRPSAPLATGSTNPLNNDDFIDFIRARFTDPAMQITDNVTQTSFTPDDDEFVEALQPAFDTDRDSPDANARALSLLGTLTGIDTSTCTAPADEFGTVALLARYGMEDHSDPDIIYNAYSDLIPASQDFVNAAASLAGTGVTRATKQAAEKLAAVLGATYSTQIMPMIISDHDVFHDFTAKLTDTAAQLYAAGKITQDVVNMCNEVAALTMDNKTLTQSLRLRSSNNPGPDYSFARLIINVAVSFCHDCDTHAQAQSTGSPVIMAPMSLIEMHCPAVFTIVNADAHAKASVRSIAQQWSTINNDVVGGLTMISLKKITKLSSATNALKGAKQRVTNRQSKNNKAGIHEHRPTLSSTAPTPKKSLDDIVALLKKTSTPQRSRNTRKSTVKTYSRPNRRRPNNPALPGKITKSIPAKDIHFFADCSGSMSLEDYRDTTMLMLMLAKRLGTDFYFSSFSHVLSQPIHIPIRGKSVAQLKKTLERIPKVTGGTDFANVYRFIESSPVTRQRLNIMATDFAWQPAYASHQNFTHPDSLVYVPAFDRTQPYAWEMIKREANSFADSMRSLDPHIGSKMLGM